MPFLPLDKKPYVNIESEGNNRAFEKYIDASKDDFMNNGRRPGLGGDATGNCFVNLGTNKQIDGLFYLRNKNFVAAFSNGKLFKVTNLGVATEITGATLNAGTPVQFADFGDYGYFCNNSEILKWTYADSTCAFVDDVHAPNDATHLGSINSYLLALRTDSERFEWGYPANPGDPPDTWDEEYASAESRPDYAVALHSAYNEIFIPGTGTVEVWGDTGDPDAPFQRISGATSERGCAAPYSVALVDNTFFYLDSERRVVRMNGRNPSVISNPFDAEFQKLSSVADAVGISFNASGQTKYIITFPVAKKTYAYDYKLDYWAEWSYRNITTGVRENWLGICGVFAENWNKYLVGSRQEDGKIYIASNDYVTDGGQIMSTEMWTPRVDWGTSKKKASTKLRVKVKRGVGEINASTVPKIMMYFRDDGKTQWSSGREISLGKAGDNEMYVTFRRLGSYYNRQWRFVISDGSLLLVSAEEDIEVVG